LKFGTPGGVWRSAPDFRVSYGVVEGRRYYVAAHVEGPSGHAESEIVEVVAVAGDQSVSLSANRHAPPLDHNRVCSDFISRTRKPLQ
jgi:hypothetical protein